LTARYLMVRGFLLSVLSSWLISPLGVYLLQVLGLGSDPYLVLTLLSISASAPFQLLFNECLATGVANGRFQLSKVQLVLLIGAQILVCIISVFFSLSEAAFGIPLYAYLIVTLFSATSTILSYNSAIRYYALTVAGVLDHWQPILVGALPGVVTITFYIIIGFVKKYAEINLNHLFLLSAIIPAVLQLIFIVFLSKNASKIISASNSLKPSNSYLLLLVVLLSAGAALSTMLRQRIAFSHVDYAAMIIVCLNMVGTIIVLLGRVEYFFNTSNKRHIGLLVGGIFIGTLGLAISYYSDLAAELLIFFSLQLIIASIVTYFRLRMI
jgi:hypothetical protein